MAVKPENQFRQSVHRHLSRLVHQEKMNNPYGSGTADDWYSGRKADLWVEYKFIAKVPKRGTIWLCNPNVKAPDLSRLQQAWLRGRHEEGRNVAVIVGCSTGGIILPGLTWEGEITPHEFTTWHRTRLEIAKWIEEQTL